MLKITALSKLKDVWKEDMPEIIDVCCACGVEIQDGMFGDINFAGQCLCLECWEKVVEDACYDEEESEEDETE